MKNITIKLLFSVVVGVLVVGGAYQILERITPDTPTFTPAQIKAVSNNTTTHTALAPAVKKVTPYTSSSVVRSSTPTTRTVQPIITLSRRDKQLTTVTPVVTNHQASSTANTQQAQTNKQATNRELTPIISTPFASVAPRVIAMSGDVQPFQNPGPRKGPPLTDTENDDDDNFNTDIIVPQPLPDGLTYMLLLSLSFVVYTLYRRRVLK